MQNKLSLFCASFLGLFLELTLIRFLPANVLAIWYFQNLVLIAAFLGWGLGAILTKRKNDLFNLFPPALTIFIAVIVSLRFVDSILTSAGGEWNWNYIYSLNTIHDSPFKVNIIFVLTLVYILVAGLFTLVGYKIARLMEEEVALKAYGTTLLGGLAGVAVFSFTTFVGGFVGTPVAWFVIIAGITLWLLRQNHLARGFAIICLVITLILVQQSGSQTIWSPYYSINTKEDEQGQYAMTLFVNRFFHQGILDFNKDPYFQAKYLFPYYFKQPKNLLILGAGTGNDVTIAEVAGAEHIDAVEIDPTIAKLGMEKNPAKPYQDERVNLIIDDARSFLKKSDKKYDMIIMVTLDSHALLSAKSTVHLDNFVYTKESLEDVKHHLNPDGVAVMLFSAGVPELAIRLQNLVGESFSDVPHATYVGDSVLFNTVFVAGPGLRDSLIHDEIHIRGGMVFKLIPNSTTPDVIPTDDWPYLYLYKKSIPTHYIKAILVLLGLSVLSITLFVKEKRKLLNRQSLNFFSLGAAFLLLETKTVTTLSLLFGSTWIVNSFVFGAIFIMLYLSNVLVSKLEFKRVSIIYGLIILSLLINYLLPSSIFLGLNFWLRALCSSLVRVLPIFFAAIAFSISFKHVRQEDVGKMYGVNLAGAVTGGFLEYASMIFGLKALYIIAGVFYLTAWATSPKSFK
ncbi:hypothetical protein KW807_00485 [Candidatus Parcubacteria bacterium]|nr:hypothetical protein [Candidatus Parcubacteria bacterium]